MCEALGSIPSNTKENNKNNKNPKQTNKQKQPEQDRINTRD
jgi:hypothetical protein